MHNKKLYGRPAILCVLLLFCFGCAQAGGTGPSTPVTYNEIVLDTYDPVNPGVPTPLHGTYMELWSSDGKTLLASNNFGTGSGRPHAVSTGFACIDYTGGLTSGVYWVLVTETLLSSAPDTWNAADAFGYAIRVMVAANSYSYGTAASDWGFVGYATDTQSDQPIPSAPLVGPDGLPTRFQTMVLDTSNPPVPTATNHLNRYLVAGGVNWIKITLP